MFQFNTINVLYACLFLNLVIKCQARVRMLNRCPSLNVDNGRVRLVLNGNGARITCNPGYRLGRGSSRMACIKNAWNDEYPVCERNSDIQLSCDFESLDDRMCGWKNDHLNDVDWIADRSSYEFSKYITNHVTPGSTQYFSGNYISLSVGDHGSHTFGRLVSPQIRSLDVRQTCLIFSYKVTTGRSLGLPKLTVFFGNIPHWQASSGEGKAIIGLYKFDAKSNIYIQGKSCKAAIDNVLVTEGLSCIQLPYAEEEGSCHDHCGIDSSHGECSCSWSCFDNGDCCDDIEKQCPYIKSPKEMEKYFITTRAPTTASTPTTIARTTTTTTISTTKATTTPVILSTKMTTSAINYTSDSVRVPTSRNVSNVTALFTTFPYTISFTLPTTTILKANTTSMNIKSSTVIQTQSTSQSNLITKSSIKFYHTVKPTIEPLIIQNNTSTKLINIQNETTKPEVGINHTNTIMFDHTTPFRKLINPFFITNKTKSKVLITYGLPNVTTSTQSSNIQEVKNNNLTNSVPNVATYNTTFLISSTTYTTTTTPITINTFTKKTISNPIVSYTSTYSREVNESKNEDHSKIDENNLNNYINLTTISISIVILAVILISFKYTLTHLRSPPVQTSERLIEMDCENYRYVELE